MENKKKVIIHKFNGHADGDEKFVEVDGEKFVDDGEGKPKLDENKKPIPFVEKKEEKKVDQLTPEDLEKMTPEQLAEKNPTIAKMLKDIKDANATEATRIAEEKKKKDKEATEKGEFEKLATDRAVEITNLTAELDKSKTQLGKYVDSVKNILEETLKTIADDKKSLIPEDFSPRQKLEYITKNAKLLGAKVGNTIDTVIPSDGTPPATDEGKLIEEIEELRKKGGTRTPIETDLMIQKAKALKALRIKNSKKDE